MAENPELRLRYRWPRALAGMQHMQVRATRRLSRRLWVLLAVQIVGSVPLVYGIFSAPTFQGMILLLSMSAFLTVTARGAVSLARFAKQNGSS